MAKKLFRTKAVQLMEYLGFKVFLVKCILLIRNIKTKVRESIRISIIPLIIKRRSSKGIYAINICNSNGFGAKLEWLLQILVYCDENNLKPAIKFSYPDEKKSDYFLPFLSINPVYKTEKACFTTIESITELGWGKDFDAILTFDLADSMIKKYLLIQQVILEEVNNFCQEKMFNKNVLGIHYRGTDKSGEAPTVPYAKVFDNVLYYLSLYPETDAIFLSTDDNNFEKFALKEFKQIPVIVRMDSFKSNDNTAIHLNKTVDKKNINRDAIVNCLILSRCTALMKTSSFLSDWSKLFNLKMPVIMLNKPYESALWFPARQILNEVLFQAI